MLHAKRQDIGQDEAAEQGGKWGKRRWGRWSRQRPEFRLWSIGRPESFRLQFPILVQNYNFLTLCFSSEKFFISSVTKPSTASSLRCYAKHPLHYSWKTKHQVPTSTTSSFSVTSWARLVSGGLRGVRAADIEDIKYLFTTGVNGTERCKGLWP